MSVVYQVVHRRNHAAAAIALVVTGLLILLSAFQPLILVTGPDLSLLTRIVDVSLTPSGTLDPDPIEFWFWMAGITVMFGLILLSTRVRGLGILWRILAFFPLLILGGLAGWLWYVVSNPQRALVRDEEGIVDDVARSGATLAQDLGLFDVSPGAVLIVLSAAVVVGIVALMLPSAKSQRYFATSLAGPVQGYPQH